MIIIDDFYDNPEWVREQALSYDYMHNAIYPGQISKDAYITASQKPRFLEIINEPIDTKPSQLFGKFRSSTIYDTGKVDIHVDDTSDWAVVIYMNTPEQCRGGTQFFRHKETGKTNLIEEAQDRATLNKVKQKFVYEDGLDRSKWDVIDEAEMKFNRAIIFPTLHFHSFTALFGDSLETGRLVQLFFMNKAKDNT